MFTINPKVPSQNILFLFHQVLSNYIDTWLRLTLRIQIQTTLWFQKSLNIYIEAAIAKRSYEAKAPVCISTEYSSSWQF